MANDDSSTGLAAGAGDPATPWRAARKVAVGFAGAVVIAVGIVLIPLPGPGWLIVFSGMAILATEFPAARRTLDRAKTRARRLIEGRE